MCLQSPSIEIKKILPCLEKGQIYLSLEKNVVCSYHQKSLLKLKKFHKKLSGAGGGRGEGFQLLIWMMKDLAAHLPEITEQHSSPSPLLLF